MQYRLNPSHQSREKGQCAYVHIYAHCARTGFFPDKRPCSFPSFNVLNNPAKFRQNPESGSPGKVFTD